MQMQSLRWSFVKKQTSQWMIRTESNKNVSTAHWAETRESHSVVSISNLLLANCDRTTQCMQRSTEAATSREALRGTRNIAASNLKLLLFSAMLNSHIPAEYPKIIHHNWSITWDCRIARSLIFQEHRLIRQMHGNLTYRLQCSVKCSLQVPTIR